MTVTPIEHHRPRWQAASLWAVKGLLAVVFLAAGGVKIYGVPMMIEEFDHIGFGQWFRYFTGAVEIAGGLAILTPAALFAALMLTCVMLGAIVTHLFVIGGSPAPAIVLLALNLVVAISEREKVRLLFA